MIPETHKNYNEVISLQNKIAKEMKQLKAFHSILDAFINFKAIDDRDEELVEFVRQRVEYVTYLNRCIEAFENYQRIEKKYPHKSNAEEHTHFRDIRFSLWHRSLDQKCYALDLDFLEMRKEDGVWVPKMIYDIKQGVFDEYRLTEGNIKAYKSFAYALDIPFAVIFYKHDLSYFTMHKIINTPPKLEYVTTSFNERGMRTFIESL